jgi:hypothetical protein
MISLIALIAKPGFWLPALAIRVAPRDRLESHQSHIAENWSPFPEPVGGLVLKKLSSQRLRAAIEFKAFPARHEAAPFQRHRQPFFSHDNPLNEMASK